jgi:hypothetical protein
MCDSGVNALAALTRMIGMTMTECGVCDENLLRCMRGPDVLLRTTTEEIYCDVFIVKLGWILYVT